MSNRSQDIRRARRERERERAMCGEKPVEQTATASQPPYPFCRTPDRCAGRGYCDREIACNE